MTAVNIAVVNGGQMAHILTDGAVYRALGNKPRGTANKFFAVPQASTVVAFRGCYPLARAMTRYCDGCASFDEMLERFSGEMKKHRFLRGIAAVARVQQRLHPNLRHAYPVSAFSVFFVGYSESAKRVRAICVDSESERPFAPQDDDTWIAPGGIDSSEVFGLLPSRTAPLERWGQGLLEVTKLQRRVHGAHLIGRHAIHTMVAAGGIQSRLIHRWAD